MAGLGWLDSSRYQRRNGLWLRIDGGLGLVRLFSVKGNRREQLRIDGGLGLVRLFVGVGDKWPHVAD